MLTDLVECTYIVSNIKEFNIIISTFFKIDNISIKYMQYFIFCLLYHAVTL